MDFPVSIVKSFKKDSMIMLLNNEILGNTKEIAGRERVWTPNFSFKKPIELLWSETWSAVSYVEKQFSAKTSYSYGYSVQNIRTALQGK